MKIIGVGNPGRGDDAAGLVAVRRLAGRVPAGIEILECEGDLTMLLDHFSGVDNVVLIDAASSGAEPGTVRRFEAHAGPLPAGCSRASTHSFGVVEAIELARVLGRLPRRVIVYAVEGARFEPAAALSPEADRGVNEAVRRVIAEVRDPGSEVR